MTAWGVGGEGFLGLSTWSLARVGWAIDLRTPFLNVLSCLLEEKVAFLYVWHPVQNQVHVEG